MPDVGGLLEVGKAKRVHFQVYRVMVQNHRVTEVWSSRNNK